MKAAALRGALSDRARSGRVHVVDGFVDGERPSTKAAIASLAGLATTERSGRTQARTLVVLERGDDLTWLSLRNVDTVHLIAVDQLNTYDVLLCDDVVFTKAAYDAFVGARGAQASAAPAQPVAADPTGATTSDVAETPETTETQPSEEAAQ